MRILIAPDSFKDSLSAAKVAESLAKGIKNTFPKAEITLLPLADGGEGTLEAIKENYEYVSSNASDALSRPIESKYLWEKTQQTAFIEMAQTAGLEQIKPDERNPLKTTTYGVGQQIIHALHRGAKNVILFVGGSATNDAGIGMAAALGYLFYDKEGNMLNPIGESLSEICQFDYKGEFDLNKTNFTVATDVTNPFYGKNGAAFIYAKQKGATDEQIISLDHGLENISRVIKNQLNIDTQKINGTGAAGGLGGGAVAFLGSKLVSAADLIFETLDFQTKLHETDVLISGEGCIDAQTLQGKLISRLISLVNSGDNIEIILVGGTSKISLNELNHPRLKQILELKKPEISIEYSKSHARQLLESIGRQIGEDLKKADIIS